MEELLRRLIEAPTVLGDEEPGQVIMEEGFRELGLEPEDVPMDAEALRAHPLSSPFSWDVSGKRNVVATWGPSSRDRAAAPPSPGTAEAASGSLVASRDRRLRRPLLARLRLPPAASLRAGLSL